MKKKTQKTKVVWIVLKDGVIAWSYPSFSEAKDMAEDMRKFGDTEVKILEVVKAWEIEFPEEPAPEVYEIGLDSL